MQSSVKGINQPAKKVLPPAKAAVRRVHVSFKEREYFTENLALLLKSAVTISDALMSLANSSHNRQIKQTLAQMNADIDVGYNLSDALERSGLASRQTLALARLGEASGHLVENLQLAAQQEEKQHIFRAKIRSAMIYPSFVLTLTVVVGLGVAWFLLPRLADTFAALHANLPWISRVMIGFGTFLRLHGIVAVPIFFAVLGLAGYVLFGLPQTRLIGRRLLFAVPGIGRLMHEVEMAQFGYLLGTLLGAGLPVTQAVNLLAGATSGPQYEEFYKYLAQSLENGYSFKDSLARYPKSNRLVPPAVQQMVIAGERSGSLSEVLLTVGRTYEQKADITTNNLEAVIEPVLLVIVWIGVMLVAVAVVVPIYSLLGNLNK